MSTIRKPVIKYIKDNISDTLDPDIDLVFDKVVRSMPKNTKFDNIDRSRADKISYINENMGYVDQLTLNKLQDIIYDSINREEPEEEIKYKITLEIVNKILVANKLKKIKKLDDFVNIKRVIILTEKTIKVINDNKDYIFQNGFSKVGCRIYYKHIKTPHFTILKGMLKEVGYEIVSKPSRKAIDNNIESTMVYTITKIEK